jgi:hypothetical protein
MMNATRERPELLLRDAGFDEELAAGEFVRVATQEFLSHLENTLATHPDPEELARRLLFVATERSLRFPADAHLAAHALLRPFLAQQPLPKIKEQISAFILKYLKDPRFERANWQRVNPEVKAVFLRWILGATLEDFFRLISRNALEKHWRFRHAFWLAYLKKDLISDAWVVLGDDARRTARSAWEDVPPYAILRGSSDRSHSVLLLRVGSLTIAEWSHNGSCRVWNNGNKSAPKFYDRLYASSQLREGADAECAHRGSERYTWQRTLANYIGSETGCSVIQSEYRVR